MTEQVSFRDAKRIVQKIDEISRTRGTDRSAIYRGAMRFWLASHGFLTDDEKRALGVKG